MMGEKSLRTPKNSNLFEKIRRGVWWRYNAFKDEIRQWHAIVDGKPTQFAAWNSVCAWQRLCFTHDATIGWRFFANHKARIYSAGGFYMLRTNSIGMRSDREYPRQCPSGRRRIVLLGDSYTAGDGVSNGERFSDLLEQRFSCLDVMNFGLPNSGTDQQLLIFEHIAKDYEADAYVFCITVENIFRLRQKCRPALEWGRDAAYYRAKPYFVLKEDKLVLKHVPVPMERREESNLGDWRTDSPNISADARERYAVYEDRDSIGWQLMRKILERFFGQTDAKPVFIVPLPTIEFFDDKPMPGYMRAFMELMVPSKRWHLLDVLADFKRLSRYERNRCTRGMDPHYSAFGHHVVADTLVRALETHCPDFLGRE